MRRPTRVKAAAILLGLLVAVVAPIPLQYLGYSYFISVGFLVLLNAILGAGWNVVGGWAGQFDFGPNVFFATGAYTAAVLFVHLALNPWLGLVAGAVVSALVSAILTYPITRLRGHYFAIATVAMWMIAQPIGATWEFINGSRGLFIPFAPRHEVLESIVTLQFAGRAKAIGYYYVILALFVLTMYVASRIDRSKLGFYFRAIRDDQEGAEGIGIDSRLYKVLARAITGAVFGMGGVVYAFWALAVFPDQVLDLNWATLPMMAAVVGGIGTLWGPVLGAVLLIPISQGMGATLGAGPLAGRGIDLIVYGIIIMVVAAVRPNGLLSFPWAAWARRLVARGGVVREARSRSLSG